MTADDMDPDRREYLTAKFSALNNVGPMDPNANTQVRAVDRADEIMTKVWGDGPRSAARTSAVLFDPVRVPIMAAKADAAAADFHRREGEASKARDLGLPPSLRYYAHDTDYDPDVPAEQGVVQIWRVGSNHVDVVRDRWRDPRNRDRRASPAEDMATILQHSIDMLDSWDCGCGDGDGDCDTKCNVRIAKACSGVTRLLPANRGTLIMLFRCCEVCANLAEQIAVNTYKTAVIEARADLPPGARIMPNPDPDVNPDALA